MLTPQNARNMLFTTKYPPDKIVGDTLTGSFEAAASSFAGLGFRTHRAIPHTFGVPVFLQMSYSLDGGATWQDQHVPVPDLSTPSSPVFQTVEVGCYSTNTDIVMVASNYTTSTETISFRIVPIWNDRQSQVIVVNRSQSANFIFSTQYSLPKIYLDDQDTLAVAVSSGGPPPSPSDLPLATHDLGFVPNVRVWYEPVSGELWPLSPNQYSNLDGGSGTMLDVFGRAYATTTELRVELYNFGASEASVPVHYRVYCDE